MTWNIDSAHSEVNFSVRHMMISNVRGQFQKFSGTIDFDETNPANSTVAVEIDVASLSTGDEKRDTHLRSRPISLTPSTIRTSPSIARMSM